MKLRSIALVATLAATPLLAACGGSDSGAESPANGEATSEAAASGDASSPAAEAAVSVTDAADRTVTFDHKPERIVLGEQRAAYATMILNKDDPTDKVIAWGKDMERAAPDMYAQLLKAEPEAKDIPQIGSVNSGDLSVEGLLQLKPDVYVMTLDSMRAAEQNGLLDKIEKAKIPYVVTDFRVKPATNTAVSMKLLGQIFDREDKADEFLKYYDSVVDPLIKEGEKATDKPVTFMWRAPGLKACCSTWNDVNFGQMLAQVGGTNLAAKFLKGEEGDLTPEQLLASQPDILIATGGAWSEQKIDEKSKTSYLNLGYDTDEAAATASLKALGKQPGFDHLKAFENKKVHGIYHQFYDAPYNFIAYQAFAKWQHPEKFTDVDPAATWKDFSEKFMPFPAQGTVVASID
ncbi:ABC transporter substrate-binding protein [Gephyromycinifex aptenodytis]|uniref:ABC transporter substrate-binding protein n=1 Tax=Gephyromycinifex aptenodytis TaxID=2716227 RepID=UPI001D01A1C3|nr:ABC transporter substrate-binding protein [Gephyromycinifex aptenodytis]